MADAERAKFSIADGRIEIEGSEAFVSTQLAKLEPLFSKVFQEPAKPPPNRESTPAVQTPATATGGAAQPSLNDYRHLYAKNGDGKLKILKSLPGEGKASKTISAALLLTLGNELDGKVTTLEEVRATCAQHACLDSTNFAGAFKKPTPRSYFTGSGSGSKQVIVLTHPGRERAKELASSLNK